MDITERLPSFRRLSTLNPNFRPRSLPVSINRCLCTVAGQLHSRVQSPQAGAQDGLSGGHIIMLGAGNQESALAALEAYPGGMQVAGQSVRCTGRCVSASWDV